MNKILLLGLILILILSVGCGGNLDKYSYEFLGSFDTIIQVIGYSNTQEDFDIMGKKVQERFMELHKLYDIYNSYQGINNIKTINDNAGIVPVVVGSEIIDLLEFSIDWYKKTGGMINIALGPVLNIWHEHRLIAEEEPENASLPKMEELLNAALKSDINKIKIDKDKGTVYLEEKGMSIDVGAVAKGFATELVANELIFEGYTSFVISSGGNVKAVGEPQDKKRTKWGIGIQNPRANEDISSGDILDIVYVKDTSVVSSGDYQRYYIVDDIRIHHLIDPSTLMPSVYYRSVTVITKDSGIADFLSSTIFLLPYKESRKLVESLEDVEALWIFHDGSIETTDNMKSMLKNLGGAGNK